jgi:transposase-like protein
MPPCPRSKKEGRAHGFTARTATPFAGYRWPRAIIVLAVRLYCQFRLSAANVRGLLAEQHVDVSARMSPLPQSSQERAAVTRRSKLAAGRVAYAPRRQLVS